MNAISRAIRLGLTSSALVMVMTVGLASSMAPGAAQEALNTMMMSVVALGVVSVQWVLVGYSIAFGHGTPWWGGLAWLGFKGVGLEPDARMAPRFPAGARDVQLMFAFITPALISGASWSACAFAHTWCSSSCGRRSCTTTRHWVWVGGWLAKLGALDFAGGRSAHQRRRVGARGRRMLDPGKTSSARDRAAQRPLCCSAGSLWFGWFGFNAARARRERARRPRVHEYQHAAATAMVAWCASTAAHRKATAVGAATGSWSASSASRRRRATSPCRLTGVGALAALVSYTAIQIRAKTTLDDSLDVSLPRARGSGWALLTVCSPPNWRTRLAVTAGWPATSPNGRAALAILARGDRRAGTAVILALVQATLGAKAGVREQLSGLDLSEHGEEAYFGEQGRPVAGVSLGQG